MKKHKSTKMFYLLVSLLMVGSTSCVSAGKVVLFNTKPLPSKGLFKPTGMSKEQDSDGLKIKVVTFNLYGKMWDKEARIKKAQETLQELNADIIFIQEVSDGWFGKPPSKPFMRNLNYPYEVYFMLEKWGPFYEKGLMVLSRFPLENVEAFTFDDNPSFERKGYIVADVKTPHGYFSIINLQLSYNDNKKVVNSQVEEIHSLMAEIDPDEVLLVGGDFNYEPESSVMQTFFKSGRLEGTPADNTAILYTPTFSSEITAPCLGYGAIRLDYLLLRTTRERDRARASIVDTSVFQPKKPYPSDHCPVWSVIKLK